MADYHTDARCAACGGPLECHRDAVCEACVPESRFFEVAREIEKSIAARAAGGE